jgi:hypothetical protein
MGRVYVPGSKLCWFLVFILIHTTLVFATGLLRNLNMGYAARDSGGWIGPGVFAASMVMVVVAWVAATPLTLRRPRLVQRVGFALIGPLQRLFEHVDTKPGRYSHEDISPYFWRNGAFPQTEGYRRLFDADDPRSGAANTRSPMGRLLLARRRTGRGLYYDAQPIEQMRNPSPCSPTT